MNGYIEQKPQDRKAAIFGISRLRCGTDGPGITTLVTFMGCLLRCRYCLNDICHEGVYESDGITPRKGIMLLTPQELYEKIKIDNIYFQATGGGICFGGGEPGLQVDFIEEFKRICPSNWKITLETSLEYGYYHIPRLAAIVDHWIVDIKDMNGSIYEKYTGCAISGNNQYLRALKMFVPNEKVTIKVPHIPDFNTTKDVKRSIKEIKRLGFTNIIECQYIKKESRHTSHNSRHHG